MAQIIARVVSQKGTCSAGHKVGNEFVIGQTTSSGICTWALEALFPFAQVLQFGGTFPWSSDPDKTLVACPDPGSPVVFELRRVNDAAKGTAD